MDIRVIRKISLATIAVGLTWLTASCGGNGAANNDQGMSVTFLGLFNSNRLAANNAGGGGGGGGGGGQTPGNQGCGQLPEPFGGGYLRLGEAEPEPGGTVSATNLSGTDAAGAFVSVVGLQNNLYGQAFRAERLLVDFFIPGASQQPPSTNVPVFLLAGPAESAAQTGIGGGAGAGGGANAAPNPGLRRPLFTSLPPSFSNLCNRSLAQVTIVPAAVREWLNFNRDVLPEPPFQMEVTLRLNGLSSSGNRYDTNDATFDFTILPESYIEPTSPDGSETPEVSPTSEAIGVEGGTSGEGDVGDLEKAF